MQTPPEAMLQGAGLVRFLNGGDYTVTVLVKLQP